MTNTQARLLAIYKRDFETFITKNGRGPTAKEIDQCQVNGEFAYGSRTIQRNFGGLPQLRELLGLEVVKFRAGRKPQFLKNKSLQT